MPESIKTIGDWIQVKRLAKNLTRCHLALKMGIATAWVQSWENGSRQPDIQQLEILSSILEFNAKDFEALTSVTRSLRVRLSKGTTSLSHSEKEVSVKDGWVVLPIVKLPAKGRKVLTFKASS